MRAGEFGASNQSRLLLDSLQLVDTSIKDDLHYRQEVPTSLDCIA